MEKEKKNHTLREKDPRSAPEEKVTQGHKCERG